MSCPILFSSSHHFCACLLCIVRCLAFIRSISFRIPGLGDGIGFIDFIDYYPPLLCRSPFQSSSIVIIVYCLHHHPPFTNAGFTYSNPTLSSPLILSLSPSLPMPFRVSNIPQYRWCPTFVSRVLCHIISLYIALLFHLFFPIKNETKSHGPFTIEDVFSSLLLFSSKSAIYSLNNSISSPACLLKIGIRKFKSGFLFARPNETNQRTLSHERMNTNHPFIIWSAFSPSSPHFPTRDVLSASASS